MHSLLSSLFLHANLILPMTLLFALAGGASGQNATFSHTGADQTYVVPAGITAIHVKLWGAGGGREGGSGAFVSGNLAVTPGETLTIIVGGGGVLGPNSGLSASAYGGGGMAVGDTFFGPAGAGGGRSAIRRGSTELVTAGAGGGGYGFGHNPGGAGGLLAGVDASTLGEVGRGGTQTAGGSKAPNSTTATNGSQFQGGTGHNGPGWPGGPGGGSGFYGGGGGASDENTGGAGGGSSYTVNLTSFVGFPGSIGSASGVAPGGSSDPSYAAGVGRGGSSSPNAPGGHGRVVFGPVAITSVAPTVTSATQASITDTTAVLGGNVTTDGGAALSARGVVISPTASNSNPQIGGANVANLSASGPHNTGIFTVNASALQPSTQYSFAAYATNSSGTGYTTPVSTFTTSAAPVAVSSLLRVHATPSNASSVSWTLTFASAVTGLNATHFTLGGTAASGATVGAPITSNAGLVWTIPVNTGSSDGVLTLNLANATGLSKPISNSLPYAGESYTMDKTPPQVLSVTRLNPGSQTTSLSTMTFRVTYSEPVVLNLPEASHFQILPVGVSSITGMVTGVSGSGDIRDVTVNITGGSGAFKLRVLD
jgi:hypothetical protein